MMAVCAISFRLQGMGPALCKGALLSSTAAPQAAHVQAEGAVQHCRRATGQHSAAAGHTVEGAADTRGLLWNNCSHAYLESAMAGHS